jgi:hypothetical protein
MLGLRREVRAWKPDFTTGALQNRYEICHQLSPPRCVPRRNAFSASFGATGSSGIIRCHQLNPFLGRAKNRPISDALAGHGKQHDFRRTSQRTELPFVLSESRIE